MVVNVKGETMKTKTTTQAKHTPGPWTTQPIGDESECNILGGGRELIATVSDNDANLIASSPDLLAAAKGVLEWMELALPKFDGPLDSGNATHQVALRAAILKAEGGR